MEHNRHLHMDLVLSLILLAQAKRKGKRIKGKLTSIIRKLYGVSSGRSIIFSPAWDFIRSSLKAEIKAPHINLCRLAAHLPDTKQLLTPPKIQGPRSQWHRDLEATAEHYLTPNKLSTKLCQQDGEINWQEVIMNLILPCQKNTDQHLLLLNRFSILTDPVLRQENWHYLLDTIELGRKGGEKCVCV